MDEIMSAFLKFGASLILPSETYNTLFNRDAQYQQLYNGTGDEPNSLRTDALEEVKRKDGSVSLDIGTRETGKTVLAHRLAEYYGRPTYSVSPEEKPPSWITPIKLKDLDDLPTWITVILDDLPAYMSNRDYENQLVQSVERIVPMVRHKRKWHLIFNTQSSAQADKYILDCELAFFKPLGVLMDDAERPAIRRIYKNIVTPFFEGRTEHFIRTHAFMKSRTYCGGIAIAKPPDNKQKILVAEPNAKGTYEVVGEEVQDADEE
jgi:hypothetical protein